MPARLWQGQELLPCGLLEVPYSSAKISNSAAKLSKALRHRQQPCQFPVLALSSPGLCSYGAGSPKLCNSGAIFSEALRLRHKFFEALQIWR